MCSIPGNCGYPIIGDCSIKFYRDPELFIAKNIEDNESRVFQTRLLNKPTVFVCSSGEAHQVLCERSCDFDHGYHDFLFNSYGQNILFENGESAAHLKSCMQPMFFRTDLYDSLLERTCQCVSKEITKRKDALNVYEVFKSIMTKLCLELFLGISDADACTAISELSTQHWHGIISVPLNVKIPFGRETGWRKALLAKEELIKIIRSRMKNREKKGLATNIDVDKVSNEIHDNDCSSRCMMDELCKAPFRNPAVEIEQHILLFVSALIPKAFASIISSFILETAGDEKAALRAKAHHDADFNRRMLLEVQRLWPPFIGGRRIANKDTTIGKYKVPKGYAAVYVSYFAHRDPDVFSDPEEFVPDRWLDNKLNADDLLTFGGGPRSCLGTHLIQHILNGLTKYLLQEFSWTVDVKGDQSFSYKLLPVTRPDPVPFVRFKKLSDT